jgi:peptide/nickel transport system substrate-binding protein
MIFFLEDWQFDEALSPLVSSQWIAGGKSMKFRKENDHTIRFEFAVPNPSFSLIHYSAAPAEPYRPRHFLKQYHIKYNPDADSEAKDAGFESWQDRFLGLTAFHYGEQDPSVPVLDPWRPVKNDHQGQRYERNPYYWKVDSEGSQLPYIDEVVIDYANDIELANLRAVSGEMSVAGLDLLLSNYPVVKRGEEDGNYRAFLASSERGSDIAIAFNQEHKDPVLKRIFNDVRFRQAASVAIDREEINNLIFLEQSTPRQATINETATFYKPEWGEHFAQFDPDLANKLLDEVGLAEKGPNGIRLRPDGEPMSFQLEFLPQEGPKGDAAEMVVEQWARVGLDVSAMARERGLLLTRLEAGEQDASMWHVDRQLERAAYTYGAQNSKLGAGGNSAVLYAKAWRDWFSSGGESGVEPPEEAKQLEESFIEWQRTAMGTPEYEEAAVRVHDLIAETLWVIGVVGQGPQAVIVKNDLENVLPESILAGEEPLWWGAGNWFWHPHKAEQWFFKS